MVLNPYFETNDGSLPEIEVHFPQSGKTRAAFEFLFAAGARDVTVGGATLWSLSTDSDLPFPGIEAAALVIADKVHPFHIVLAGIKFASTEIPDLGVFFEPHRLTLDYRMGSSWGEAEVHSFLLLLKKLVELGGTIEVPWWGVQGKIDFMAAIKNV